MNMKVAFNNLNEQYQSIRNEIDDALSQVISSSAFIRGPFVEKFEEEFALKVERSHCTSCANGTDALFIAMKALDLGPEDEVIAPAHSWISSSSTIKQAGGKVVFCDTDKDNFTINPQLIEEKITPRTVGIIPVHLFGQPADMNPIMDIAKKHKLWVIEDCAQAHLAEYESKQVGSFGDLATYSFYPGKNLGAMGDAGAIVTNDSGLHIKCNTIARHGGLKKGEHLIEGINSRMDGLQAAILSVKLKYLTEWTKSRRSLAQIYMDKLSDVKEIQLPIERENSKHVFHLFVIKNSKRDLLATFLSDKEIQTVINYPIALPFLPAYSYQNNKPGDFINAFHNQSRIISLPLYPEIPLEHLEYVVKCINEFVKIHY